MGLTRLFGGASGITNQPQGLDIGIGGSNLKSVQRGLATLSNGVTTLDVTVSTVNQNNCILKATLTQIGASATASSRCIKYKITNNTTINFSRIGNLDEYSISWVLEEYNNVKSKQVISKSIANASVSDDTTITSVNVNKTITENSFTTTSTSTTQIPNIRSYLSSSTIINTFSSTSIQATIETQILEFN